MSNHTTFRPLSDRIVIEMDPLNKAIGKIVMPDNYKSTEFALTGKIVCQGPGKVREDGSRDQMPTEVGQRVIFSTYAGNEIKLNGKECRVVRPDDIMAILEDATA